MASGDILKNFASWVFVNCGRYFVSQTLAGDCGEGTCLWIMRMPSRASGDSRFDGFQPPGYFSLMAALRSDHSGTRFLCGWFVAVQDLTPAAGPFEFKSVSGYG